jgi:hypothetical protein
MADNYNQTTLLYINDSSDDIGFVTNYGMTFNQGGGTVYATITLFIYYKDKNPLFDCFVQNQPATLKLEVTNSLDSGGPTTRTIEFQNAMCRNYMETYDMTRQTSESMNDLMAVVTIEADSATVGETTFPA